MTYISAADRIALFKRRVRAFASLQGMPREGYPCWVDPDDRRVPVFAVDVGMRVASDCSGDSYGVRFEPLRRGFREYSDQESGVVADCPQACPEFIAPDGTCVHAIGFWHGWAWEVTLCLN